MAVAEGSRFVIQPIFGEMAVNGRAAHVSAMVLAIIAALVGVLAKPLVTRTVRGVRIYFTVSPRAARAKKKATKAR